jgi:hypothetical protein
MSSKFFDAAPYILAAGAILLGAFEIIKDWKDYKSSWLKMAVATVFIIVGAVSIASLYHEGRAKKETELENKQAAQRSEQEMQSLRRETEAANLAQVANTKLFLDSLSKMSSQVSDLKTEVKTEALQKRLGDVQSELAATRKALAPGPKAELIFTFVPFFNPAAPADPIPSKEVTLPLKGDGSVHFEFSPINPTDVDATDVGLDFYICDVCKYAKEPDGFTKLKLMTESERFLPIPHLHALEALNPIGVDMIVPRGATRIVVGFSYRCNACSLHVGLTAATSGTINIDRSAAN